MQYESDSVQRGFCYTFCADTHLAHLLLRSCGGKRAKLTHKQKDMPKVNARTEKNHIKISATALLKTGGQEREMTIQTKQNKSNNCPTAPWQYGGRSGYMNFGVFNQHYSTSTVCN